VTHPASAGRLSALRLQPPLVRSQFSGGVATLGACFVLPVEGAVPATPAKRMGLRVSLTEGRGTYAISAIAIQSAH